MPEQGQEVMQGYPTPPNPGVEPVAAPNFGVMDRIRSSEAYKTVATAAIGLAAVGMSVKTAINVVQPSKAEAAVECTTTTITSPDGSYENTTTECSYDEEPSDEPDQAAAQEPKKTAQPAENASKKEARQQRRQQVRERRQRQRRRQARREARRERGANSQKGFPGYDMGDSPFTDGNGCFVTAAASALRRETGNGKITPRRIYYPELRKRWSPSGGVNGFLFDALPAIAARHDVKVWDTGFKGALRAKKRGDEVMMLAEPGYFTGVGHYMAVKGVAGNGKRLIIDDPNGKGRHGNSERRSGWSGRQLKSGGVIDYRVLRYQGD